MTETVSRDLVCRGKGFLLTYLKLGRFAINYSKNKLKLQPIALVVREV